MTEIVAISVSDFNRYGCPNCGGKSLMAKISGMGTQWFSCCDCKKGFCVLNDGQQKARIGVGDPAIYPLLQKHPRA